MKAIPRTGEEGTRVPVRGERFFKLEHFWFFATREGAAVGPYDTKSEAMQGVQHFIAFARNANRRTLDIFAPGGQRAAS